MNGYGRAAKADGQTIDELDKIINRYKWVLLILNGISFFVAIGAFSVCVWIRFDLDFWEWVVEIDWYTYWYAIYLIMVTLCLVIANSIVGLFGTVQVCLKKGGNFTSCKLEYIRRNSKFYE
jgi:hypothetical protein